jgi:hypothetical protein
MKYNKQIRTPKNEPISCHFWTKSAQFAPQLVSNVCKKANFEFLRSWVLVPFYETKPNYETNPMLVKPPCFTLLKKRNEPKLTASGVSSRPPSRDPERLSRTAYLQNKAKLRNEPKMGGTFKPQACGWTVLPVRKRHPAIATRPSRSIKPDCVRRNKPKLNNILIY